MRLLISRAATLGGLFGLLALITAWILWLAPPPPNLRPWLLGMGLLPLLIPAFGVLRGGLRSHLAAALAGLLYLIHGIGELFAAPSTRALAITEIGLSLSLFIGGLFYIRWRRAQGATL